MRSRNLAVAGSGLSLLLMATWITAVPVLLVQQGWGSPFSLAVSDTSHIAVGLSLLVWLAGKIQIGGFAGSVPGMPNVMVWERWLSASIAILIGAAVGTGFLLLVPFNASIEAELLDAHLLVSIWALVPVVIHAWRHRHMVVSRSRSPSRSAHQATTVRSMASTPSTTPSVAHRRRQRRIAVAVGVVLALSPVAAGVIASFGVAPLARLDARASWVSVDPSKFYDRLSESSDHRWLVAGGTDVEIRAVAGGPWRAVGPFGGRQAPGLVLGLDLPTSGSIQILVGTTEGLWAAPALTGPYVQLPMPGRLIHGIVEDPGDSRTIWVTSSTGVWQSTDGGQTWTARSTGMGSPQTSWALGFAHHTLYASDENSVYEWSGNQWQDSNNQYSVVSLDQRPGGGLTASSMGAGVDILSQAGGKWESESAGLPRHDHGAIVGTHVVSVSYGPSPQAWAGTMLNGVGASLDGGKSWTNVWPGLRSDGTIWRVLPVDSAGRTMPGRTIQLVAATDHGLETTSITTPRQATNVMWIVLAGLSVALSALGLWLATGGYRRHDEAR